MTEPTTAQPFGPPNVWKRTISAASLMLSISLAAGCSSILSGAGPSKAAILDETPAYSLVKLSSETITPYLRMPQMAPVATISSLWIPAVRLQGGDELDILISDNAKEEGSALFAPLATGGTKLKVRVDSEGKISLPYVGRHIVAGMTLPEVEDMIRQSLKGITTDAQAHVELVEDISGSVLVAGAVKQPGRFSTLQGPLTLLDAINQAGGPVTEPHLVNVTVRSGSWVKTLNYEDVLSGQNMALQPHSEVILERARKRFVAMGAVGEPGLHDLPSNNPSLLEALGSVGGLKEGNANPRGVFVFRLNETDAEQQPKAEVFSINMRDPEALFLAQRFALLPEDTIYVTNAAVYEWQKIISPIVQVLVLGRAVGVTY